MTVDTRLFTADELLRLPDDGHRYELVRGELRKMSPAGHEHAEIAANIITHLRNYVRAHALGKVYSEGGFLLERNPDTMRGPDAGFVRKERLIPRGPGFFPGPPDLAVEIISPNDLYVDVDEKTSEYLRTGTRAVIVVNPRNGAVRVHRPTGVTEVAHVLDVDDVVPGWRMTREEIFEE